MASAAYDAANEQTAFAGAALSYDNNGNLTNDGTNTYVWDARNRLVGISGGATASFVYDPLGRRTSKTINSVTSQFAYDGNNIVAEIGGGAVGANYLRSLYVDDPFVRQLSTGNEHYHTDALGSSFALSNAQGASSATYTYEPFGKGTSIGGSSNALQYTGRENDGIGLAYFRARYFHPSLQRWISEDPIGFAGGDINFYSYAGNSPVRFTDPLGLRDDSTPWQVGWEWLTGGQKAHHFTDGDPFTELLRQHNHIQDLIQGVSNCSLPQQGRYDNDLSGVKGVGQYVRDYSTLLTMGQTGNLAAAYLGSYNLQYSVTNNTLNIHVTNTSSIASATHPPIIGYTDWWNTNIGAPLNNVFSSGPLSATTQEFDFNQSLGGRGCACK